MVRKAIEAKSARAGYTVTPSAKLLMSQRRLLPDAAWDRAMRLQFPQPGA